MSPTLQTLLCVAAGIAVVVLGILVFRLHAFFALLLAAATTAACTPAWVVQLGTLRKQGHVSDYIGIERPRGERNLLRFKVQYVLTEPGLNLGGGEWLVVDPGRYATARGIEGSEAILWNSGHTSRLINGRKTGIIVGRFVGGNSKMPSVRRHIVTPVDAPLSAFYRPGPNHVLVRSDFARQLREAPPPVPTRIAAAFGDTVGSIGLLIAFASVIGMCLLDSGAADRIVRSALRLVGERGAPLAFASCGFLLGVPVFFDTVFLLMIPLGKALRLRTGRDYVLYVLTIVCGATMAHSLVPPTPGPLLVAEELNVDMGTMILVGTAVGLVASAYGLLHATVANRFFDVPLRDTPEMPLADLQRLAAKPDHELPPIWASLLPIVLPVWLIGQQAALQLLLKDPPATLANYITHIPAWLVTATDTLGEKNVAVGIGVVVALVLLVRQTGQTLGQLRDRVGAALASGGSIILITAAGGAFGKMIEQTGVSSLLKEMPALGPAGLLTLAFLVTTAIRTAQGSSTVAMITAVGIFSGVELPFHPVWLALSIGCGSKPFSWMTDSGFWVICKMSGMTEAETLKTLTPMTAMMGLVGLATVIAGATVFPMK